MYQFPIGPAMFTLRCFKRPTVSGNSKKKNHMRMRKQNGGRLDLGLILLSLKRYSEKNAGFWR
jgi:hypothetical protein